MKYLELANTYRQKVDQRLPGAQEMGKGESYCLMVTDILFGGHEKVLETVTAA